MAGIWKAEEREVGIYLSLFVLAPALHLWLSSMSVAPPGWPFPHCANSYGAPSFFPVLLQWAELLLLLVSE